ncbi:hypothetical protein V2J09_002081 [Rumex salicifolius]
MGQKASALGARPNSFKKLDQKRQEEQKKAANASDIAIEKIHLEVQKEVKQLSDANLKREEEQQQVINKLQEQTKESSSLVKGLRSDLEDARQKMSMFDIRVHELETQVLEEHKASSAIRKRAEELEAEILRVRKQLETEIDVQRVWKELEDEKAAREEAWAKISAMEQEMNIAMEELDLERRRLKVATDKMALVEAHLRDFQSTAEEMKDLFGQQRDQLKEMQMSLVEIEDGIRDHDSVPANQTSGNGDIGCETTTTTTTEEPETVEAAGGEAEAEAEQLPANNSVAADKAEQAPELAEAEQLPANNSVAADKAEQAPELVLQMTGISN